MRACVHAYMWACVHMCLYMCVHTYISFVSVYVLVFPSPNFLFHFVQRKKSINRRLRYTKKTLKTHTFPALLLHPPRLWTHTLLWRGWKVIQGQVCNHSDTDNYKDDNDCDNDAKNYYGNKRDNNTNNNDNQTDIIDNKHIDKSRSLIPILSYQHIYI